MGRKPNNVRADAMYLAYSAGLSLEQVGERYGCSRQSVYEVFKTRGLPLRPKPTPLPFVEHKGKRYTISKTGYYRCTTGRKNRGVLLHRVLWEEAHGPIPYDHDIHHRNGDKTDNRLENLECISRADHARRHHEERSVFPSKACRFCKKLMQPHRSKRPMETPSAFARRQYCDQMCFWQDSVGTPKSRKRQPATNTTRS